MAKPKVFLDSSVIITALLSSRGGAFYILNSFKDRLSFQTNEFVFQEVERILKEKFFHLPGLRLKLFLLMGTAGVVILRNSKKREVIRVEKFVPKNDAPILASALKESDYLLTLDNDFLQDKVLQFVEGKNLRILKPRDLIQSKNF